MSAKLLSPSQAAELLGVPPSTLRLWAKQFKMHLSAEAQGDGRRRRHYTSADLAALARARDLLREGRSVADVNDRLGLADDEQPGAALVTLPTIAGELEQARSTLMALRSEVADLRQVTVDQAAQLDELRRRLDDLQARRSSWWDRLWGW